MLLAMSHTFNVMQTAQTTGRKSARGKRLVDDAAAEPGRKKGRLSEPTGADTAPGTHAQAT